MKHYYYLHTNGGLIHKSALAVDSMGAGEYFDSDFVVTWWLVDDQKRSDAWNLCIFALKAGAKRGRVDQLIEKWKLTNEDAKEYCERVGISLGMDGNAYCAHKKEGYTNMMEHPTGFGDTAFDAICDFYNQVTKER